VSEDRLHVRRGQTSAEQHHRSRVAQVVPVQRRLARREGLDAFAYSNPLYYLSVGYSVLAIGLIFAVSALAGFYN
jgi:hypothetical protein